MIAYIKLNFKCQMNEKHQACMLGFPGGSDSRESACNVRDLGLIPGLGRSSGERNGFDTLEKESDMTE